MTKSTWQKNNLKNCKQYGEKNGVKICSSYFLHFFVLQFSSQRCDMVVVPGMKELSVKAVIKK